MHIRVVVTTDASKEKVEKVAEDEYHMEVKEPAENNRANHRVRQVLADELDIPMYRIHLMRGHHHSSKLFMISATMPTKGE
jgi:uncharacterized protein YggU (UPF0235/DUF167 family)